MRLAVTGPSLQLVGWAVPILAVLLCAPSAARASCGDYVVTRAPHAAEMPSPAKPVPHKPCSGPHCSRGPAVPSLPVPTVVPPAPPEWGSLAELLGFEAPYRGAFPSEPSPSHPVRLTCGIFHPPRRAA